jgi:hypothetical protein
VTTDHPEDAIDTFLHTPLGRVFIGHLHDAARTALESDTSAVFLSAETLVKQRREHPELTREEYLALPTVLATPDLVLQWEGLRVAVLHAGPHDLVAVIKTTTLRHENYLVSFRRTERKDVLRMVRKARVILGDISQWSHR